jgi:hypothetical protein
LKYAAILTRNSRCGCGHVRFCCAAERNVNIHLAYQTCYAEFRRVQETVNNIKSSDTLLNELHVLVAECAFKTKNYAITRTVLEKFLQLDPQQDHLYCRAKVLLGLLII